MTISTTRFGSIEFDDLDVVTFPTGILGFPDCRRFVLVAHKEDSPFRWLQSADNGSLAFLVVDPATFFPEYAPEMEGTDAAFLQLSEDSPRLVYTMVTIPKGLPGSMTVNLAGPIVINADTRYAKQIVLTDEGYGTKHPVPKTESPETVAA
ncbi:MAG: Flagellar assembly factor FliW [Fimbriimonadaceae bacterium]|nr:Flagellar assembly factor FliW [Fimbriimonadaceae bacterium]